MPEVRQNTVANIPIHVMTFLQSDPEMSACDASESSGTMEKRLPTLMKYEDHY